MLTSLPASSSTSASTTRTRSSSESRGHRYGARHFSARSSSLEPLLWFGQAGDRGRPTMRGRAGSCEAHRPASFAATGSAAVRRDGAATARGSRQPIASAAATSAAPQRNGAVAAEPGEQRAGDERPEDARQAADRLRDAHHLALLLAPGAARDQAVERGLHQHPCRAPAPLTAISSSGTGCAQTAARKSPSAISASPASISRSSPKRRVSGPISPPCIDRRQQPDIGKDIADLRAAPSRTARSPTARRCSPSRQRRGSPERRSGSGAPAPGGAARRRTAPRRLRARRCRDVRPAGFPAAANDDAEKRRRTTARPRSGPGSRDRRSPRSLPARRPPSAGPMIKPRPKAAPIMPMPLARFSGVVTSAI